MFNMVLHKYFIIFWYFRHKHLMTHIRSKQTDKLVYAGINYAPPSRKSAL